MPRLRPITTVLLLLACAAAYAETTVEDIRIWAENDKTRIVLDLSRAAAHSIFTLRGPDRLVVDLDDGRLARTLTAMPQGAGAVRSIRSAIQADGDLRVVLDLNSEVRSRSFTTGPNAKYGDRLVIDLQHSGEVATVKRASESYRPGRDIVIAIDPGHGGKDPGAVGKRRTREKDVALSISRKLVVQRHHGQISVTSRPGETCFAVRLPTDLEPAAELPPNDE